MSALSAPEVLRAWELGCTQRPLDWALTLLSFIEPAASLDELAALPIGERDARLLRWQAEVGGPLLDATSRCPACDEQLEFTVDVRDFPAAQTVGGFEHIVTHESDGYVLQLRMPSSSDVAQALAARDVETARAALLQACVLAATREGQVQPLAALPEPVLAGAVQALSEADAVADVLFDVTCPECGNAWQVPFDITVYCAEQVAAQARRLMADVLALARSYGWREADILAMSPQRRQAYLELTETAWIS